VVTRGALRGAHGTAFRELRPAEVHLLRMHQRVEKPSGCSLSPQIGYQTHRFWGVSSPILIRLQLNADFFNKLAPSTHSGEEGQEEGPRHSESPPSFRGSLRVHARERLQAAKRAPERREPPLGLGSDLRRRHPHRPGNSRAGRTPRTTDKGRGDKGRVGPA
jgi:hypothetical protein